IRSMMEHCFLLAHERELSFLKGVVPAESIGTYGKDGLVDWSADMAILNLVEDEPVVYLMNIIRKIEQHIISYTNTNDLVWKEIAADEDVMEQSILTWLTIIGELKYEGYADILNSLGWLIECYGMVIWNLAYQQILGLEDVFLETELEYYTWDGDAQSLEIVNENALFLLGIYADIQLDAAQIEQFKTEYNGKV
ncbi:hypothetical protein, partial [Pedobacter sp. JCM 36344]|uniref:hypothetical protein n=1 Tax=Pedobacter sp. JCM 36344 TaxID=3374280 RepID=UPI00397B8A11